MQTIGLISLNGGTGRTTLTANLGRCLSDRYRAFLVELDRSNTLGLHFGMKPGESRGIGASPAPDRDAVLSFLRERRPEVPFIPFGTCSDGHYQQLEMHARGRTTWLRERIRQLAPPHTDIVLIDTPSGRSPWQDQVLLECDLVLVVSETGPTSYAALVQTERVLDACAHRNGTFCGAYYVLNRVDTRRPLSRDLRNAFRNQLGDRLIPTTLTEDEAVRTALASGTLVSNQAPHSLYTESVAELATWVSSRLGLA